MTESQKRLGSNLTDEELEDIKRAVRADQAIWSLFLKYCVVGFPEGETAAYRALALRVRPDANLGAIAVAVGDLRCDAADAQGLDLRKAQVELVSIEKEEARLGRPLPHENDKEALIELFERAGGRQRSKKNS